MQRPPWQQTAFLCDRLCILQTKYKVLINSCNLTVIYAFNISLLSWCFFSPDYLWVCVVWKNAYPARRVCPSCILCVCCACPVVLYICVWVGVSSLFCPHILADRQTAQCSAAVFDRLINTGSGRWQQTQFVFRAETFKPPFPVTTLRGIMSFLHRSFPHPDSVFLQPASTDMWSGCFTRHLYAKNVSLDSLHNLCEYM